ncbi:MAG: M14 family metallopeptidase [Oscillospiraceae bacterium]|jgi:predicted deacylase|nr:M14 family metallopeptidase [Oscillospiraceae bacterium]MDD3260484.1 M14 family metallopeptidase [Oscillospiraceae bacterium]
MEETIVSAQLAVDETLEIRKNRVTSGSGTNPKEKRLCIVTGTHGDELEGQYVCWQLNRILHQYPERLHGTVDIYPALNPLGINTMTRGIPMFDLDMNRIFPGSESGAAAEYIAAGIIRDIKGADVCIDIHASNIYLRELPQVRVSEDTADTLLPLAKLLNVDFVWVHAAATVLESTLAHSLNTLGTPTLVVEMGVGMRITEAYGQQLIVGILNLMHSLGMWDGPVEAVRQPVISRDGKVSFINAGASGVFLPTARHHNRVVPGQQLGVIADPLSGEIREVLHSPAKGTLFTLREYPIVYEGSLIARILGEAES